MLILGVAAVAISCLDKSLLWGSVPSMPYASLLSLRSSAGSIQRARLLQGLQSRPRPHPESGEESQVHCGRLLQIQGPDSFQPGRCESSQGDLEVGQFQKWQPGLQCHRHVGHDRGGFPEGAEGCGRSGGEGRGGTGQGACLSCGA